MGYVRGLRGGYSELDVHRGCDLRVGQRCVESVNHERPAALRSGHAQRDRREEESYVEKENDPNENVSNFGLKILAGPCAVG